VLHQLKWISLGQITNFIIPLMLTPVLARRLGLIGFASFAVLTGIAQYATLGVELGLNYVGISEIKRASSESDRRSIFSEIFYLKIILAVVVCATLTSVAAFSQISTLVNSATFALLLLGPLVTCVVCPVWFFILKNRLDINFNIVLGSRLSMLILCYMFVKGPGDYIKAVALFNFATLPFAALYAMHWLVNVRSPMSVKGRAMAVRLWSGLQLSGAMLRETITNVGIAPMYGLFAFDSALGSYAFAEKMSKIFTMPAPLVASAIMASTPNEQKGMRIPHRLRLPLWAGAITVVALYGAAAVAIRIIVGKFFPQFGASIPMVYLLASVSPLVYFNYIELGMRYTKQGRFRFAARMSYAYLAMLFAASLCLTARYGVLGLAMAAFATELLQAILLLKFRSSDAAS
jgi:O-antigen/teichoic acid export membrane protein